MSHKVFAEHSILPRMISCSSYLGPRFPARFVRTFLQSSLVILFFFSPRVPRSMLCYSLLCGSVQCRSIWPISFYLILRFISLSSGFFSAQSFQKLFGADMSQFMWPNCIDSSIISLLDVSSYGNLSVKAKGNSKCFKIWKKWTFSWNKPSITGATISKKARHPLNWYE